MCRDGSYRAAAAAAAGRPWRPGAEATRRRGSSSAQDLANFFFFLGSDSERFTFLFSVLEARRFQHRQLSELCGGEDGLARGGM